MWWMMPWADPGSGWMWLWMGVGWLSFLLFWGGVIALVVWVVRRFTERPSQGTASPLDIAKARYARGEISKEEFEELKRTLHS